MYKYITTENEAAAVLLTSSAIYHGGSAASNHLQTFHRINQAAYFCNPYFNISLGAEGLF